MSSEEVEEDPTNPTMHNFNSHHKSYCSYHKLEISTLEREEWNYKYIQHKTKQKKKQNKTKKKKSSDTT